MSARKRYTKEADVYIIARYRAGALLKDIAFHLGRTTHGISKRLELLQAKGIVERRPKDTSIKTEISIRLPRDLHTELRRDASERGLSFNQLLNQLVVKGLRYEQASTAVYTPDRVSHTTSQPRTGSDDLLHR